MAARERKFFVGGNWKMNGSKESINRIISFLKEGPLPPESGGLTARVDDVENCGIHTHPLLIGVFYDLHVLTLVYEGLRRIIEVCKSVQRYPENLQLHLRTPDHTGCDQKGLGSRLTYDDSYQQGVLFVLFEMIDHGVIGLGLCEDNISK